MNNRQNGRRRGRGGQQTRGGQPGIPDRGNRVDNRARGNAAQLLEKYKSLARDAQMQGDRVNTEYYLQFADHYFRVLSENRNRFEDQRPDQRARADYRDDVDGDDEPSQRGFGGQPNIDWNEPEEERAEAPEPERRAYEPQREQRPDRDQRSGGDQQRPDREPRAERDQRPDRAPRPERAPRPPEAARAATPAEPEQVRQDEGERYQDPRPRRAPRTPRVAETPPAPVAAEPVEAERIEVDRLPQGFGTVAADVPPAEDGEAPRPRRRATRRPRAEQPAAEA